MVGEERYEFKPSEQFTQLQNLVRPTPAESVWTTIPWMIDMWAARQKAAAEDKPLVVWSMSGEALGHC
jgi:hypothetical protein